MDDGHCVRSSSYWRDRSLCLESRDRRIIWQTGAGFERSASARSWAGLRVLLRPSAFGAWSKRHDGGCAVGVRLCPSSTPKGAGSKTRADGFWDFRAGTGRAGDPGGCGARQVLLAVAAAIKVLTKANEGNEEPDDLGVNSSFLCRADRIKTQSKSTRI